MQCIDLRTVGRYRVWNEAENRAARKADNPWDLVAPGRSGFIAPWGPDTLVACTNRQTTTDLILRAVPPAVVAQDGTDGQNVVFPADRVGVVAKILRVRTRRAGNAGSGSLLKTPPVRARSA
jgi:hypothetical protein